VRDANCMRGGSLGGKKRVEGTGRAQVDHRENLRVTERGGIRSMRLQYVVGIG